MRRRTLPCAALLLALAALPASAGKGPNYSYGEMWWAEYLSDKGTALLLHFGPPTPEARAKVGAQLKAKKDAEPGLDDLLDGDKGRSGGTMAPESMVAVKSLPSVDETRLVAGTVADYSERRRVLKLGPGFRVVPEGRFGQGLAADGSGAIRIPPQPDADGIQSVECWFRVETLPKAEACLLSVDNDETRLLLLPDGRLELRLKKPHGIPRRTLSPEVLKVIEAREAAIISAEPVATGAWNHVLVRNIVYPAPADAGCWEAVILLNGMRAAGYMSESGNKYAFLGWRGSLIVIGNDAAGKGGFAGLLDEVRASTVDRAFYGRPVLPWRDATSARPLQFDRPFFREDGTVLHASFDKGLRLERSTDKAALITMDLRGVDPAGLLVEGIRGKAMVMDPEIGMVRVPLPGMNLKAGALEFWLRPQNWDDCTGYWANSPPVHMSLSVARLLTADGKTAFDVTLPRAFNNERKRVPLDPSHWAHLMLVWDEGRWGLFVDGTYFNGNRRGGDLTQPLAWAEFGIPDDVTVAHGQRPRIEVDEVVGYSTRLRADEVKQARERWKGELKPINLYEASFQYKWSIHKVELSVTPLLPDGTTAAVVEATLLDLGKGGAVVAGPVQAGNLKEAAVGEEEATPEKETKKPEEGGKPGAAGKPQEAGKAKPSDATYHLVLSDGPDLPYGTYQFRFRILDKAGKEAVAGVLDWNYKEEPWRHCQAGLSDTVIPPPWTPITASGSGLQTLMTAYELGADGLPAKIRADGADILAAPFTLQEAGKPMAGRIVKKPDGPATEKTWTAEFAGAGCDIRMQCRLEYDGMIRYELAIAPKGPLAPIAFVMPVASGHATRWLACPIGTRGPKTGEIPAKDGLVLSSRTDPVPNSAWQQYMEARKKDPKLSWEQYWEPLRQKTEAYGFYGHVDLNDLNRGLWWFCDNAAGWSQSKKVGAVEIVRKGDSVSLVLNLVAEPGEYKPGKPIVFGVLPHPARPLPDKHRLFNKGEKADPRLGDVYDAFFPWGKSPRSGGGSLNFKLFPATDPKKPEAGPSWEYAETCVPLMKMAKPQGLRTLYLDKAWFSCRAGAYDNWEWRSGESSSVSLTPSFNNYLCWEMNEWIRRDIWDAVYLDECYEHPARNLEAGFSVRLPDGSEQPGVTNFRFRELMKRWRTIFVQSGKEPFLIAHLTGSWQYHGVVFCDSYLDGENHPIVSLNSRDWIDSTSRPQFEMVQNARLWGVSSFYMPFVSEGGFGNKMKSQFPRWQWRMARQAQSQFAHYETSTVYEGQGSQVYKSYWNDVLGWGAGTVSAASFHPYWDNAKAVQVEGQGGDVLVSYYKGDGRILLIASNRRKTDQTMRVALDLAALGLKANPSATARDSSFDPPSGEDYLGSKAVQEEARKMFESGGTIALGEEPDDKLLDAVLEGPDELKARAEQWTARLEGNVLVLPVRARDFRLVAIE